MKKIITLLALAFCLNGKAQTNLVPNPSFEIITQCPTNCVGATTSTLAVGWLNPNIGSADLFSTCDTAICGGGWNRPCHAVPLNCWGMHYPHSGNNYVGFAVYGKNQSNAREYVEIKMIDSLLANRQYCISFYTSIADSFSGYATSRIGAYISKNQISNYTQYLINVMPQMENPCGNILNNYT